MKQMLKEWQIEKSEKMSKKAKSGCKQMLKGLQNEDGDNLQKSENADFRGQPSSYLCMNNPAAENALSASADVGRFMFKASTSFIIFDD
ncbi:hypothetical protein AVEN_53922-1 [Araneus ventricosus]|uniref:Uncharacterized protein n=1 Tax=Araneus ventricosus TaxID=182803 RepID=A0A4Y2MHJ6_ARAVE|nr:hypothetical protein AVEN_53922-1 [Araneus ventricosus]